MGFVYLPGMFLYALFTGKLWSILSSRSFYIIVLAICSVVVSYYLLREHLQPGYLDYVLGGELWQRYSNTSELYDFQERDPFYYLKQLINRHFQVMIYLVPIFMVSTFFLKDRRIRSFSVLCTLTAMVFFIVISNGTRNEWYDAPLLPLLSLIIGIGMYQVLQRLKQIWPWSARHQEWVTAVVLSLLIFSVPYSRTMQHEVLHPYIDQESSLYGDFMERLSAKYPKMKAYFLYSVCTSSSAHFYLKVYNEKRGYQIRNCTPCEDIADCQHDQAQPGDSVAVCNHRFHAQLVEKFHVDTLYTEGSCYLIRLNSPSAAH
jgi:hypothetical protein